MKLIYPCIVHSDDDGYWADFPDFKGCYADGDNLEEILESANKTLQLAIIDLLQYNKSLPSRTDITQIQCDNNSFSTYINFSIDFDTNLVQENLLIPQFIDYI